MSADPFTEGALVRLRGVPCAEVWRIRDVLGSRAFLEPTTPELKPITRMVSELRKRFEVVQP